MSLRGFYVKSQSFTWHNLLSWSNVSVEWIITFTEKILWVKIHRKPNAHQFVPVILSSPFDFQFVKEIKEISELNFRIVDVGVEISKEILYYDLRMKN